MGLASRTRIVACVCSLGVSALVGCHVHEAPSPTASSRSFALAGAWDGGDWGVVDIDDDGTGTYEGTYGTGTGRLSLTATAERTFEGTWGESEHRFGTLTLELGPDGRSLTGTWTPDARSTIGTRIGGPIGWTRR